MKKTRKNSNYSGLLPCIQEIFFKDLDMDEVLLEIVDCCGKRFGVSRFMIGLFDENIEEYTFQYMYENEKTKNISTGPMTMKGKKFNPGFRDQLEHKIYFCEDTSTTKDYEELKGFYDAHQIRSNIFTGIWRQNTWCGTVGMHECFNTRKWESDEIELLNKISTIISWVYEFYDSRELIVIQKDKINHLENNLKRALTINNSMLFNKSEPKNKLDKLISAAELRVLKFVVEGHTNLEIARKLNLSKRTVETHITSMLAKLEIKNRVQLTRIAMNSFDITN